MDFPPDIRHIKAPKRKNVSGTTKPDKRATTEHPSPSSGGDASPKPHQKPPVRFRKSQSLDDVTAGQQPVIHPALQKKPEKTPVDPVKKREKRGSGKRPKSDHRPPRTDDQPMPLIHPHATLSKKPSFRETLNLKLSDESVTDLAMANLRKLGKENVIDLNDLWGDESREVVQATIQISKMEQAMGAPHDPPASAFRPSESRRGSLVAVMFTSSSQRTVTPSAALGSDDEPQASPKSDDPDSPPISFRSPESILSSDSSPPTTPGRIMKELKDKDTRGDLGPILSTIIGEIAALDAETQASIFGGLSAPHLKLLRDGSISAIERKSKRSQSNDGRYPEPKLINLAQALNQASEPDFGSPPASSSGKSDDSPQPRKASSVPQPKTDHALRPPSDGPHSKSDGRPPKSFRKAGHGLASSKSPQQQRRSLQIVPTDRNAPETTILPQRSMTISQNQKPALLSNSWVGSHAWDAKQANLVLEIKSHSDELHWEPRTDGFFELHSATIKGLLGLAMEYDMKPLVPTVLVTHNMYFSSEDLFEKLMKP